MNLPRFDEVDKMPPPLFRTLLVANRGEIACRIMRTAKRLGMRTIGVYSEPDARAPHVAMADEAICIGSAASADSYLRIDRLIDAIKKTGRIVSGNLSELVGDIVAGDGNLLRFSRKAPDPMLAHITALNMLEVIAGKQDFRGALIFVMQNVNPAVNYRFDSTGSFTRDSATRKALAAFDAPLRKRKVDLVVAQKDMTGADTRAARRRDTKGARISDDAISF